MAWQSPAPHSYGAPQTVIFAEDSKQYVKNNCLSIILVGITRMIVIFEVVAFLWRFFRPPCVQLGLVPCWWGDLYFYERHFQVGTQSLPRLEVELLLCHSEGSHAFR